MLVRASRKRPQLPLCLIEDASAAQFQHSLNFSMPDLKGRSQFFRPEGFVRSMPERLRARAIPGAPASWSGL